MFISQYREYILKGAEKYYKDLGDRDFSHNFDHFLRVERLVKRIGEEEGADLEVLEAASLLFDIARKLEDEGKTEDHAKAGSKIARQILTKIGFPEDKIEKACHAVLVHRKSQGRVPEIIEAKILQDADYLDAMGAVDVARVIASSLQSEKYKRPIYLDKPFEGEKDDNTSAIHYLLYKIEHPKLQPDKFHTRLGRELASERFKFMKTFADTFIKEWRGEK